MVFGTGGYVLLSLLVVLVGAGVSKKANTPRQRCHSYRVTQNEIFNSSSNKICVHLVQHFPMLAVL